MITCTLNNTLILTDETPVNLELRGKNEAQLSPLTVQHMSQPHDTNCT